MKKKTPQEFSSQFYNLYGNEYELLSEYETAIKKIKVKHTKCGNTYYVTPNKFLCGRKCPICKPKIVAEKESIGFDVAKERVNNFHNGKFELIKYKDTSSKCTIECLNCHTKKEMIYGNLMAEKRKCRCESDNYFNLLRQEKEDELIDYCNNNQYKLLERYKTNKDKILIKHIVCGFEWKISPSNLKRGFGCPKCAESKMEKETSKFLDEFNIEYIQQYKFEECKNIFPLPFDFYLPKYNICIECD